MGRVFIKVLLLAVDALNNNLGFLLEDKESIQLELQRKFLSVLKMLLYVYTKVVLLVEKIREKEEMDVLAVRGGRGKKRKDDSEDCFIGYNQLDVVVKLMNLIEREISFFWDPPVVEDTFVG